MDEFWEHETDITFHTIVGSTGNGLTQFMVEMQNQPGFDASRPTVGGLAEYVASVSNEGFLGGLSNHAEPVWFSRTASIVANFYTPMFDFIAAQALSRDQTVRTLSPRAPWLEYCYGQADHPRPIRYNDPDRLFAEGESGDCIAIDRPRRQHDVRPADFLLFLPTECFVLINYAQGEGETSQLLFDGVGYRVKTAAEERLEMLDPPDTDCIYPPISASE